VAYKYPAVAVPTATVVEHSVSRSLTRVSSEYDTVQHMSRVIVNFTYSLIDALDVCAAQAPPPFAQKARRRVP